MAQPQGIGESARALGTTPRALRYYEQLGLIGPAQHDAGGRRRYDDAALEEARRVLTLRRLGLSLAAIAELRDADAPTAVAALVEHADRLGRAIDELVATRRRLTDVLQSSPTAATVDEALDLLEELSMRITLTRIYTRTGDDGTTALGGNRRVDKTDVRLEVMGDVDEVVSALGVAIAADTRAEQVVLLRSIQNDLFDLGADLAALGSGRPSTVTDEYVGRLEHVCDEISATLTPPASFVLPGSDLVSAALHQARAICRRAERHAWATEGVGADDLRYLNRLSDLLFLLARAREPGTEPTWAPAAHEPD